MEGQRLLVNFISIARCSLLSKGRHARRSNYKNETLDFNTKRKDRLSEVSFEIKKYINNTSLISIQTSFLNNESNQKAYDYDTFHSYVFSEQKRYEKEVDSLLTSLIKYERPKIK